jgi:multidrug transporter EmrE-like cation transporter
MKHVYLVALAAALVMNATANLMMKFGMERYKAAGVTPEHGAWAVIAALASNWVLMLGLCLFAANVVLYTFALKGLPISVAYPIMVTVGFAIIVVVAGWRLHERLSPVQWVGVVLILAGVWLVGSRATAQLGGEPLPPAVQIGQG